MKIPLGTFTCITGVSGSGKSTLINNILYRRLMAQFYDSTLRPGEHDEIRGLEYLDKVINIDQSPIGRTPVPIRQPIPRSLTRSGTFLPVPRRPGEGAIIRAVFF